nr:hypothetical protein [Pseudopedobacter sp.]
MKKLFTALLHIEIAMLILLWSYASIVKLINMPLTFSQMHNQVFPIWMADILAYAIPILEIALVLLLLIPRYRKLALWLSIALLSAFTIYIILIKLFLFGRIPCSCGGIISGMSWTQHLIFNLFFLIISLSSLIVYQKERRWRGTAA